MPRPVVALVGCGFIGRFHSRNLRAVLRAGLVEGDYAAVCDRDLERAAAFAAIAGAATVSGDAMSLLADPSTTAVYVCAETSEHPPLVLAAAERGLAIFCEKPLAKDLRTVEAMVEAVERVGVTNQVGLVLRFSPIFTVLKDLISDGGLGPLLTAHLRDDQFFPIRGHYASAWRGDVAKAGGGTLIEHSIHDVDLFRWLFGDIVSVRCHIRETSGHPGVEDVALATFQHAAGYETTLSSIWHAIDSRPSTRRLEVFFEGGYFVTEDDFIGPIRFQLREGPQLVLDADEVFQRYVSLAGLSEIEAEFARRGMFGDLAFLHAVEQDRTAFPDFRTALAAHKVVDACYRSAAEASEVLVRE